MVVIHISGIPGSGKTTLGKWIKKNFKIKVYDIDDLHHYLLNKQTNLKNFSQKFQKYINDLIIKNKNNVIFVGLHYPDPHIEFKNKIIDIKPFKLKINGEKYFITLPNEQILWQHFMRELKDIIKNPKDYFNYTIENPDYKMLDINEWKKDFTYWKKIHRKENYQFLSLDQIKNKLKKLIQ